jgi:hypothetical protein
MQDAMLLLSWSNFIKSCLKMVQPSLKINLAKNQQNTKILAEQRRDVISFRSARYMQGAMLLFSWSDFIKSYLRLALPSLKINLAKNQQNTKILAE